MKKYFLILLLIISCIERKDKGSDLILQIPDDPISVISINDFSILSYDEGFKLINSIEGSEALWILSDKLNDYIVKKTDNMPFFN